jgi:phosphogluconate dehydratase
VPIDANEGTLAVDAEDIESRPILGPDIANQQVGMGRELFATFRENSAGAEQGAGIFTMVNA